MMYREAMIEAKGEVPVIAIVAVSILGAVILLLNCILVSWFVYKRKRDQSDKAKTDERVLPGSDGMNAIGCFELDLLLVMAGD